MFLPAEVGTVAVGVRAGGFSGDGGISGPSNRLALHLDQGGSDAAHAHSPLQPDEAVLSPAGSPGVLDQPVVHSAVSAVTNNLGGQLY